MNAIRLSIKYENAGGIFSGNQRIVRINREWQECRSFPGKIPRQIPARKKATAGIRKAGADPSPESDIHPPSGTVHQT